MNVSYNVARIGGDAIPTANIPETPIEERPIIYSADASDGPDSYWFDSDGHSIKPSDFKMAQIDLPQKRTYYRDYGDIVLQTVPFVVRTIASWGFDNATMQHDLQCINDVVERVTSTPAQFKTTDDDGQVIRFNRVMIEI